MAGDFVMVQHATPRKPEVLRLAAILNIAPAHAFGLCVIAWMWFDEQTEDGRASGATVPMLDAVVGRDGFSDALRDVGWLQARDGSLVVPNFARLMGDSAKKRGKNTLRQRKLRRASVTDLSRSSRDKSATKEEKRVERESKKEIPPISPGELPPALDDERFRTALAQWLTYKSERREAYKPTGLQAMLSQAANRAASHGLPAVVRAMETAMGNQWKGWNQESVFRELPFLDENRVATAEDVKNWNPYGTGE